VPSPRTLLLLALFLAMEVLAGFSLAFNVLPYNMVWFLLVAACAGLMTAFAVARFGPGEPWNRLILLSGAGVTAAGLALLVTSNPGSFVVAVLFLLALFWRGIVTTMDDVDHADVRRRFGWGFGALALALLFLTANGQIYRRSTWQVLVEIGVAYTVVALIALGTARLEGTREPGAGRAVGLAIGLQLGLLLVLCLGALQLFSLDLGGGIWHVTRPVFDAVGGGLFNFVLLFKAPIQHFIELIRPHPRGNPVRPRGLPPPGSQRPRAGGSSGAGHLVAVWILIVSATCALAGLLFLLWRAMPRLPGRKPARGFSEVRESGWPFLRIWAAILSRLRYFLRRGSRAAEQSMQRARRRIFGEYPDDPIRRVYTQLLRRAATAGLAREPSATPIEYRLQLTERWPDASHHFAVLTDAYILRRYGEARFGEDEVTLLQEHWQHVRHLVRVRRSRLGTAMSQRPRDPGAPESPGISGHRKWFRRFISLPEFTTDLEAPRFAQSVLVAIASVVVPILIIVALLVVLALAGAALHH
jgi:Domain of unknown function (DUF4129)